MFPLIAKGVSTVSLVCTSLKSSSITFRNRILISPMGRHASRDRPPIDWTPLHLGSRVVEVPRRERGGAAGLILKRLTHRDEGVRLSTLAVTALTRQAR
jgi:2,4-dienoyl-CoA reductase-like NADH-dependent reductase (Old Yellow Enzyme family)